jgi:uroporphyrinogen-III synthase
MCAARVIVTRPKREGARWIVDLRDAGLDPIALPLITLAPIDDLAPMLAVWHQRAAYGALMFVSAAAVDGYFKRKEAEATALSAKAAIDLIANARCWATGPGTLRALLRAGVPADRIDSPAHEGGQFDSEALWARVKPQVTPRTKVLIVRGGDAAGHATGRDWLAHEIDAAGGVYDTVVTYRRLPPVFGEAERAIAREGASGAAIWLFSSSESIANLQQAEPTLRWDDARAVATHARIAQAATAAGFGAVCLSQPLKAALVASIESLA